MEHATSAALIFTDGEKVLIEIATGRTFGEFQCDLPKGHVEDGETSIDAVVREVKEETGLNIEDERDSIIFLGKHSYNSSKDISLHLLYVSSLPDINSYYCDSCFKNAFGQSLPEVKSYKYVKLDTLGDYLYHGFTNMIKEEMPEIKKIIDDKDEKVNMTAIFDKVLRTN